MGASTRKSTRTAPIPAAPARRDSRILPRRCKQMPVARQELGPLIRNVFLPEEGEFWCKPDISQQEFRFVVHHAVLRNLPGAKEAAEHYRSNPTLTITAIVAEMTALDRDLPRPSTLPRSTAPARRNSPR